MTLSRTKYLLAKTQHEPLKLTPAERSELAELGKALYAAAAPLVRCVRQFVTDVAAALEAAEKRAL